MPRSVSRNGVAFFGRDSDATLPVWSAKDGYPGDPGYREFHRDLGWDLPLEHLIAPKGSTQPRPLGLKLHRVTDHSAPAGTANSPTEPQSGCRTGPRACRPLPAGPPPAAGSAWQATMGIEPLLVAPFDAELFGHWWFEGPRFLSAELFRQGPSGRGSLHPACAMC